MSMSTPEEINELRCHASEVIIRIMNADDVDAEVRAEHLNLLRMHAESAHDKVTGGKPKPEPRFDHGTLDEAVKRACGEYNLEGALIYICVWESERVVKQVQQISLTGKAPNGGQGWETCFGVCIRAVMDAWEARHG